MELSKENVKLLEILEKAIDPETEEDYIRQWKMFLDGKSEAEIFHPKRKKPACVDYTFTDININDAIADYQLMLQSQLESALGALCSEAGMPGVRTNYGSAIMASVFGAKQHIMPREMNTLPTTHKITVEALEKQLDAGIPDLNTGFGRQVFEMGEIFRETFSKYPKVARYVPIYHPDTQGPLDITELLLDCEMFYLIYDDPDLLKRMLSLVTDTYTAFLNKWFTIVPMKPDYNTHWCSFIHRGVLVIRNDSAMNLSAANYEEFAKPYDALLLERFGGGIIHFCGRGDHYIETMSKIPKLYGINMSQPELNDMEKIYRNTVDKGIPIFAFNADWARKDVGRPGGYHHWMHS